MMKREVRKAIARIKYITARQKCAINIHGHQQHKYKVRERMKDSRGRENKATDRN